MVHSPCAGHLPLEEPMRQKKPNELEQRLLRSSLVLGGSKHFGETTSWPIKMEIWLRPPKSNHRKFVKLLFAGQNCPMALQALATSVSPEWVIGGSWHKELSNGILVPLFPRKLLMCWATNATLMSHVDEATEKHAVAGCIAGQWRRHPPSQVSFS